MAVIRTASLTLAIPYFSGCVYGKITITMVCPNRTSFMFYRRWKLTQFTSSTKNRDAPIKLVMSFVTAQR